MDHVHPLVAACDYTETDSTTLNACTTSLYSAYFNKLIKVNNAANGSLYVISNDVKTFFLIKWYLTIADFVIVAAWYLFPFVIFGIGYILKSGNVLKT